AAKVRRLATDNRLRVVSDCAALVTPLGGEREPIVILAHYLVRLLRYARLVGFATTTLLGWVQMIPGELRERIDCQVRTGAVDIPLPTKIDHVTQRLTSVRPTGDDLSLTEDIMSCGPAPEQLEPWREALGHPSAATDSESDTTVPQDWVHVWRWSVVLPNDVLDHWQEQIAHVTAVAGSEPSDAALTTRSRSGWVRSAQSPIPAAELTS